jgi:hypothetical protein
MAPGVAIPANQFKLHVASILKGMQRGAPHVLEKRFNVQLHHFSSSVANEARRLEPEQEEQEVATERVVAGRQISPARRKHFRDAANTSVTPFALHLSTQTAVRASKSASAEAMPWFESSGCT